MPDIPIGERLFADGNTRPVFRDPACRQYVLDDKDMPVFGVWLDPRQDEQADEPVIVQGPRHE